MAHGTVPSRRKLPRGIREVRRDQGTAFEARYVDPSGKQRQRTFTTLTEARHFVEGTRTKVREGTYQDPKPAKTLLHEVAASYFKARQTALRQTTIALNASLYGTHVGPTFGMRALSTIHLDDIQDWSNKLSQTHAPGTVIVAVNLLKTKESRRTITLPGFLCDVLAAHLASFPPNVHVESETLVFTGPNGAPLRRSNFARRVWRPALKRAGLEHVSFHALRHSAAAFMIAGGADAKKIQRRLGHATIRMTYDLYGHLLPEADEEVAAGLEDLWRTAILTEAKVPTSGKVAELR